MATRKIKQKTSLDWLTPGNIKQKQYKITMKKPRLPTTEEKNELLDYLLRMDEDTSQESRSNLNAMLFGGDSLVAVFEKYLTYMGEYEGKVMVIIGDISPRLASTFIWLNGKITDAQTSFKKSNFYRRRQILHKKI